MTVGELFAVMDRDAVIAELERQWPSQVESHDGHVDAWNEIVGLKPVPSEYVCRVDLKAPVADGRRYLDVSGVVDGCDDRLAIEFVNWREWVSMSVVRGDDMADVAPQVVLAAILYEMTFAGYSNFEATGN